LCDTLYDPDIVEDKRLHDRQHDQWLWASTIIILVVVIVIFIIGRKDEQQ
jgi:uncharacterized membrane protein YhaH (DUF805 family)